MGSDKSSGRGQFVEIDQRGIKYTEASVNNTTH